MNVVFLPYLASMWASMSPLYSEHVLNGDQVTVMPLPFTTRDRDGHPMTYRVDEGFPVPIRNASIIQLREQRPDRIYFHNPYDGTNTITQIEPHFFSKHLKECTDDLTFVPYYTQGGDLPTIIRAPGVRNSDHVVVWSQIQKDRYTSILCQFSVDWARKIIIKDRGIQRSYAIPPEWKAAARGRRLIMLGTSLSAVLNDKAAELEKIHNTIMAHQNDQICLVWRPHPLYDAALVAMLPSLYKPYRNMINAFIEYDQGILDTSADLERSVSVCQEYIGDPSSVVSFFIEQNKPVTII